MVLNRCVAVASVRPFGGCSGSPSECSSKGLGPVLRATATVLLSGLLFSAGSAVADSPLQDLSGRLQQQLQNDPVLSPKPQTPLKAPEVESRPAPQPEDEGAEKITVKAFTITGNSLVKTEEIQALLRPWLNIPISLAELRRGVAQVTALYRDRAYLAQAVLPNQDITDGTVQVQVFEGKVGRIIVEMPQDQPQLGEFLRNRIETLLAHKAPPGEPLSFDSFDWAALVVDDLPGVTVSASLRAGEAIGTTDVVAQVLATPKIRGLISADNNGSRSTGPLRLNALLQLESALGLGESFNLSASKTEGSNYLRLAHSFPVGLGGWRGLTLNVSTSVFDYEVLSESKPLGATFAPKGTSTSSGLSLRYPILRSGQTTLSGELGYETRRSKDKGDAVSVSQGTTLGVLRDTRVEASNMTLSLNRVDGWGGGGSYFLTATYTQGSMSLMPDIVRTEDASGVNTAGSFRKLRVSANRLQVIDAKHTAVVSFTRQFANRNLDASEKLYLGGSSSVRAFPNSELGGSEGYMASLELRRDWTAKWQTSYFYDYGKVRQYKNSARADDPNTQLLTDVSNTQVLDGHGFSLTYRRPNGTEFKAQVSRRLRKNPLPTEDGTDKDGTLRMNRWWFGFSVPF